jgi:hypothetical protein
MDIDSDEGFYHFDLNIQLGTAVDLYAQDRKRYWENLGGWSATQYDEAERFAQAVLKNSEQLIPVEEINGDLSKLQSEASKSPEELNKRIGDIMNLDLPSEKKTAMVCDVLKDYPADPQSEESPLKLVWERFVIDMSWEAINKIEEGASRILRLYRLVLCSAPSKPTQQFLGRLSRCFIWGFDPECVILCRAVVDRAFKDAITDKICENHLGERERYDLSDRIEAARKEGLIDDEIKNKAYTVRIRGNKAVHEQPNITKDVWGTICDTLAVLERIVQRKRQFNRRPSFINKRVG